MRISLQTFTSLSISAYKVQWYFVKLNHFKTCTILCILLSNRFCVQNSRLARKINVKQGTTMGSKLALIFFFIIIYTRLEVNYANIKNLSLLLSLDTKITKKYFWLLSCLQTEFHYNNNLIL